MISILAQGGAEWVAGIALTGVVGSYIAIFAVYCKVQDARDKLAEHAQQSDRHPNGDRLVYEDVCAERVKRIEASINTVCGKIDMLLDGKTKP